MTLLILGRFPPPIDGQAVATRRLADLLAPCGPVHRVDLSAGEAERVQADVRLRPERVRHYLRLRKRTRAACRSAPEAAVLWTSVSPTPLGHLRDLLTVLPAFRPRQRVYAVVHWGRFDELFTSPLTRLTALRFLVPRVDGFVFLSEGLSERCAPWIPAAKRLVIPNTIDDAVRCTPEEVEAKQRARTARQRLRLLFFSNMIREKGYLDVLDAVRLLHRRGVAVEAHFAGGWTSGADRAAFERRVAAGRLADVVAHYGAVRDRAKAKRLYLDADVFLLPTYYPTEAQPLSILEALNAGTPVVAADHAGIPELVRHGREGLLVPPRDGAAIARAVLELTDVRRWLDLSRNARRRFEAGFSPGAVQRRWAALLQETEASDLQSYTP